MRGNSAFWIFVLATVLIIALAMGMNMLADLDPTVGAIVRVKRACSARFENSRLVHRWDPSIDVKLPEGQKRSRGLVLGLGTNPRFLVKGPDQDALLREMHTFLKMQVTYDEDLNRIVNWLQVDLWPAVEAEEERPTPVVTKREAFEKRRGGRDPNPPRRSSSKPPSRSPAKAPTKAPSKPSSSPTSRPAAGQR